MLILYHIQVRQIGLGMGRKRSRIEASYCTLNLDLGMYGHSHIEIRSRHIELKYKQQKRFLITKEEYKGIKEGSVLYDRLTPKGQDSLFYRVI